MELASLIRHLLGIFIGVTFVEILDPDGRQRINLSEFSTKTAFRHCGLSSFEDRSVSRLDSCTLVHINALYRHGTREPSQKDVRKFKDLRDRLISSQEAVLPPGFVYHRIPFNDSADKNLVPQGFEELYDLGQWIRKKSSSWFHHEPNITFYSSSSPRAQLSAVSFYHGLFNLPPVNPVCPNEVEDIQIKDHLLRFFDYCEKYKREIDKNKTAAVEYQKFSTGPEVAEVFGEIMSKHRLSESKFTTADVRTIFLLCGYEIAVFSNDNSPWCGLLQAHHLPVMEYWMDLKQYWLKAYGYELNYVQSCPLVAEMLEQILNAALSYKRVNYDPSTPGLHRASFWFGHAETLIPVVSALGLFNDSVGYDRLQKLYADGFQSWLRKVRTRPPPSTMFRSGHVAPFAGNLVLELYHCTDSTPTRQDDPLAGFFVLPRVNKRTVLWPLASPVQPPTADSPGASFASLTTVLKYLGSCMPDVYDDRKHCSLHKYA